MALSEAKKPAAKLVGRKGARSCWLELGTLAVEGRGAEVGMYGNLEVLRSTEAEVNTPRGADDARLLLRAVGEKDVGIW